MLVTLTSDHYSDRIAPSTSSQHTSGPWEFDAAGLARAIADGRRRLGWSTRDLSRRAGISQPYVVALERARDRARRNGPTPTVDVLARLGDALQIQPSHLLAASLRRAGRHVLLVVEDDQRSPLDHARNASARDVDSWIWAASSDANRVSTAAGDHSIDLRRDAACAYEPDLIARSLHHELQQLGPTLMGREVGLVFAETSAVMTTLDDPHTIVSFEHSWAEVVADAMSSIGAHAACNVCVYELAALRTLPDPVAATLDLMRSHDMMWAARRNQVSTGASGARRVLEQLRPVAVTRAEWRTTTDRLLAELDLAA